MTKKKTLKPLNKTVVAEVIFKKSEIILTDNVKNPQKQVEKIVVHAIGSEVEKVKVGDALLLPISVLSNPNSRLSLSEENKDALFLCFQEDDILGIYN